MGKKSSQVSTKISKTDDKKSLSNLIKVLRPKVYITDSSNFKTLVQELTGNIGNPISFPPPIQEPVVEVESAIIEVEDHGYQDRSSSFDSSIDSSEASMPTSFTTAAASVAESPQEIYVSETFSVLESSWNSHKMDYSPLFGDIESWLLEIDDSCSYNSDNISCIPFPPVQQEVSFYDLSSLI